MQPEAEITKIVLFLGEHGKFHEDITKNQQSSQDSGASQPCRGAHDDVEIEVILFIDRIF